MSTNKQYDVAVIGGGVQGVAVAQAVAARGWSVLLLEKHTELALGTSNKSSKLIHGGLRYLESMQFHLVRECLQEKALLCELAPDLVKPARFVIPVYENYSRSAFWMQLGLLIYRLIAWPAKNPVRGRYKKNEWQEHPALRRQGLLAMLEYEDAQTDDAALTRAVWQSAESLGAELRLNSKVKKIKKHDETFEIQLEQEAHGASVNASVCINACGPWVNQVSECIEADFVPRRDVDLVQGSHIVLDRPGLSSCYYLESPDDARAMFVLPWKGKTMVGTTELAFSGSPDECVATTEEVHYLLKAYNHYFPDMKAGEADIIECFAGLRVLPKDGSSHNKRSRETVFLHDPRLPGYLAIYGGKLTAWRLSAAKVVKEISPWLPARKVIADTRSLRLRNL